MEMGCYIHTLPTSLLVKGSLVLSGWMGTKMHEKLCVCICTAFWKILPYLLVLTMTVIQQLLPYAVMCRGH